MSRKLGEKKDKELPLTRVCDPSYGRGIKGEGDLALVGSPISFSLPAFGQPKTRIGKREGPFTGETNAAMLEALQVKHVVVSHSERRQSFGESEAMVAKKIAAAVLQVGPIPFIGETLTERDRNRVEGIRQSNPPSGMGRVFDALPCMAEIGEVGVPEAAGLAHNSPSRPIQQP